MRLMEVSQLYGPGAVLGSASVKTQKAKRTNFPLLPCKPVRTIWHWYWKLADFNNLWDEAFKVSSYMTECMIKEQRKVEVLTVFEHKIETGLTD